MSVCLLLRSLSTLGGLEPETQQLCHANAPVRGVPGASSVPHLQIQEVHIYVTTSTCYTHDHVQPQCILMSILSIIDDTR